MKRPAPWRIWLGGRIVALGFIIGGIDRDGLTELLEPGIAKLEADLAAMRGTERPLPPEDPWG